MKALIVLLFVGINSFACDWEKANYKHKSEAEIAAMTPAQLIDEEVKEQLYHMPSFDDDHKFLISKYVRKEGVKILPVLTEYLNAYDPKSASKCEEMRFFIAHAESSDLDKAVVRLRGIKEGQFAIEALEGAIERMRNAGFDKGERSRNSKLEFALLHLNKQKGTNEVDTSIKDTIWVLHKIKMSDGELLEFVNFLIAYDPTYPSWSGTDYFKDYSRISEAGNPLQVYIFKKPERFYDSYLKFKGNNK